MTPSSNTDAPRRWFPVFSGLLTWKHYQRLGSAWMLFLWFIHQERKPQHGEQDDGAVRNGEPMSYQDISASLQGMPARTVEKHIAALEREGYIRSEYVRGHGKRYWVRKPIRWSILLPKNGDSPEVGSTDSPDLGSSTPQSSVARLPRSGGANKEQEPRTLSSKTKPSSPDGEVDKRHAALRTHIQSCYREKNPSAPAMPWDGKTGSRLKRFLDSNPAWSIDALMRCVDNRFSSDVNHSEAPDKWIPSLLDYSGGALNQYGKPKGGKDLGRLTDERMEAERAIGRAIAANRRPN